MKYLIIGGVAGGASAAARLRRLDENAEIILFERGKYISYANCGLPYYLGGVITERKMLLVQEARAFAQRFNVDVRVASEVISIDPERKQVTVNDLLSGENYVESYDKMIIATGGRPIIPSLPGIASDGVFTIRDIQDTDQIQTYIDSRQVRTAVIIGAGFIGLEMAENLHRRGMQVSIVEKGPQVMSSFDAGMAAMLHRELRQQGVRLFMNTQLREIRQEEQGLRVITNDKGELRADIVILALGVSPQTELARKAGIATGQRNGVLVNEFMQTSAKDIYAVGDMIELKDPLTGEYVPSLLAGPANKQARIAAGNVVRGNIFTYKGSLNSSILKLFSLTAASTGLSATRAAGLNIPALSSVTFGKSHASYYPGAEKMTIQITFCPHRGTLLGAQIIGGEGVDKRIDMIAAVIKNKGSIFDLAELEQAYAPPFSSAKDPVNIAGFVAENIFTDKLRIINYHQMQALPDGEFLLDVRNEDEFAKGSIRGAINIPLNSLRQRIGEIPADTDIYIFCQQGMRGYFAQRILMAHGSAAIYNLSGGYEFWKYAHDEQLLSAGFSDMYEQHHAETGIAG